MGISDLIAEFINTALESERECELRRGELADMFGCVPSQVNYVISTRFSPENGYIVESRRGGGGYIRIRRVELGVGGTHSNLCMHAANGIGERVDPASAIAIITNLTDAGALSRDEARLMSAACSIQSLALVPPELKSAVRAEILKRMLIVAADD